MSDLNSEIKKVRSTFQEWESSLNGGSGKQLLDDRRSALESFARKGYPGRRQEEWKYTLLPKILKMGFHPEAAYEPGEISVASFDSMKITSGDRVRIVFVDGHYNRALSGIPEESGLEVGNYVLSPTLSPLAMGTGESMIDLNTAFAADGAVIRVKAGAVLEHPVELYNITTSPGNKMIQPRHHIHIERNAEATFVESYHNLCVGQSFTNAVHTIRIEQDARCHLVKLQHPRRPNTFILDHTLVEQEANSHFRIHTLTLSGAMVRNNLNIRLAGEQAECHMLGLYILDGEEHADNCTVVDHAVPNCYSNELYKGILDGRSTGVFNGKIIVREDAQKTNAYQNNRNILASEEATINSKPQLEIFADDVKCSHGATSAQIEDSELFYLRARGIGKEAARKLLMHAFAAEVWEGIRKGATRNFIEQEVAHSLGIDWEEPLPV